MNKSFTSAYAVSTVKQAILDVSANAWLHCVDSSSVTKVHEPLTLIVSYVLLFAWFVCRTGCLVRRAHLTVKPGAPR